MRPLLLSRPTWKIWSGRGPEPDTSCSTRSSHRRTRSPSYWRSAANGQTTTPNASCTNDVSQSITLYSKSQADQIAFLLEECCKRADDSTKRKLHKRRKSEYHVIYSSKSQADQIAFLLEECCKRTDDNTKRKLHKRRKSEYHVIL